MARTKSLPNRAELIVEAARELFSRYGYERTSIEDIAKHLSIGKGSVYLDFRAKEDILMRILEGYVQRISAATNELALHTSRSPLLILQDIFETSVLMVFEYATKDIHTPEALLHTSAQAKTRFAEYFVRKRKLVTSLLERAAEAGEIDSKHATEEMALALLMGTSPLYPPYLDNFSENMGRVTKDELEKRSRILVSVLIAGLRKAN
ncbi:MAG: TetR/AcrR family transcriptional regulator [Leptolyngbya sp.]|nr:TetR/AcrR family transcriptional regulator [Candidatus Melainabacteria bacterium]